MTAFAASLAPRRPWLSFFDFLTRDREAELRATLHAHDVTILSTQLVEDHVMKMERLSRPTILHNILHVIGYVFAIFSLRLPLHFLTRSHPVFVGFAAFVLSAIGGAVTFFGESLLFTLPLVAWAFEITIFLFLVVTEDNFKGKALETVINAVGRWHFYRPEAFIFDSLPKHIQQRLSTLEDIPSVRPRILADTNDPFLVAVSGYGPFTTRLYVGAWNTGDAKLDDFR